MNNFYLFLQVSPPSLIESQSNEVQLIYFFGTLIVSGLIAAIFYLRSEVKKRDTVIDDKNKEIRKVISEKDAEIKQVINEAHESEKENLVVLKDLVDLLDVNADTLKDLRELITTTTNPNIKEILNKVKS